MRSKLQRRNKKVKDEAKVKSKARLSRGAPRKPINKRTNR